MELWREKFYLSHHGIKGQKWGERNYQYEDGSLTPEGKRHYGIGEAKTGNVEAARKTANKISNGSNKKSSSSDDQKGEHYNSYGTGGLSENQMNNWQNALTNNPNWSSMKSDYDFSSMSLDDFKKVVSDCGLDASNFTDKQLTSMKMKAEYLQKKGAGDDEESSGKGSSKGGGSGKGSKGSSKSSKESEEETKDNQADLDTTIKHISKSLLNDLDSLRDLNIDSISDFKDAIKKHGYNLDELSEEQIQSIIDQIADMKESLKRGEEITKNMNLDSISLSDFKEISDAINNDEPLQNDSLENLFKSMKDGKDAVRAILSDKYLKW